MVACKIAAAGAAITVTILGKIRATLGKTITTRGIIGTALRVIITVAILRKTVPVLLKICGTTGWVIIATALEIGVLTLVLELLALECGLRLEALALVVGLAVPLLVLWVLVGWLLALDWLVLVHLPLVDHSFDDLLGYVEAFFYR